MRISVPNLTKIRIAKFEKFSLEYFFAFLLIVFSGFIIYQAKPVMPLYYAYFASLLFVIPAIIFHRKIVLPSSVIIAMIFSVYVLLTLFLPDNEWKSVIHTAAAVSYFIIGYFLLSFLNKKQVITISKAMLVFTFILISLETYWRITHPTLSRLGSTDMSTVPDDAMFYLFKINSFMAQDSNFVALLTVSLSAFSYYMNRFVEKNSFFVTSFWGYFLLTVLTLSRAAIACFIISAFVLYMIDTFKKSAVSIIKKHKIKLKTFVISSIAIIFFMTSSTILISCLIKDSSFISKIDLFSDNAAYIEQASITQLLFGVGSSPEVVFRILGRGSHNFITTYLLWYGLIGLFMVCTLWYLIFKETKKRAIIVILPILLTGFSLTNPGCHLFYAVLALIYYFENTYPKKIKQSNDVELS